MKRPSRTPIWKIPPVTCRHCGKDIWPYVGTIREHLRHHGIIIRERTELLQQWPTSKQLALLNAAMR